MAERLISTNLQNILRTAFFASMDGLLEQMGAETEEMNHRTSHHHIRHCFEYLRQSLICLADSNMEEMNWCEFASIF